MQLLGLISIKADINNLCITRRWISIEASNFHILFGVSALLEAARKINFRDISSQISAGFATGR